jgi:hypothetical protein
VLGADDVGAPHRRKRLWILADSIVRAEKKEGAILPSASRDVADAAGTRHGSRGCVEDRSPWDETRGQEPQRLRCSGWWSIDPADLPDTEDSERDGGRDRTGRGGESASDGGLQPGVGIGGPIESRVGRVAHGSPDGLDKP